MPADVEAGGFIADGYSQALDETRAEVASRTSAIEVLQGRYSTGIGVKALKIRSNTVIGWHIEVPANQAKALGSQFVLQQGLASTTRYSSAELDKLAETLEAVRERVLRLERSAFETLRRDVLEQRGSIARVCHAAAALDPVCGLAQAAAEHLWVEPKLDESSDLYQIPLIRTDAPNRAVRWT
ncbi:hypothetical protein [Belnapia rosea]|uniref:hypothetical protein n=1 Tax=Belnapia rosea TaxID=938405 RepID=UPI00088ECD5D|nr:hypothetical protein [Belnapia rosea]SDB74947.1 MutS family domain IV [Belnapia rosea]